MSWASCPKNGDIGGQACDRVNPCTARLDLTAGYATRAETEISTSNGIPSRQATALVFDSASLVYDPPGVAPEFLLFEKSLALASQYGKDWDEEAAAQLLGSGVGLVSSLSQGNGIGDSLDEDFFRNLFGLVSKSGDEGAFGQTMKVRFNSATGSPFQVTPADTSYFTMVNQFATETQGFGPFSRSVLGIRSNHYWAGALGNIQCLPNVDGPEPLAFWYYAGETGSHQSDGTMNAKVEAFLVNAFGAAPPALSTSSKGIWIP
ncbi:MAG: hypothetical protein AAFY88_13675 [Acidobacteriota bacterium]